MIATKRFVGLLSIAITLLGAVAILLMMVHIVADGLLRTFFSSGVPATMEFASFYYMVAVTFLPLAYIQIARGHVIVELFTGGLPRRTNYAIDGFIGLILTAGAGYFTYAATWKALAMTRVGEFAIGTIVLPTWPTRWFLVAGLGLLAVTALTEAIDDLLTAFGRKSVDEADRQRAEQAVWLDKIFGLEEITTSEKH